MPHGTCPFRGCDEPPDDEISVEELVTFEIGKDPKTGKSKAVSVDLV